MGKLVELKGTFFSSYRDMGRARGGSRGCIICIRATDKWVQLKGTFTVSKEIQGELGEALSVVLVVLEPRTNGMNKKVLFR
jgi:hypothetical protein